MRMLNGSCLCKKVKYLIDGPIGPISHCHCQSCRKAHAAAFSTVTRVDTDDFEIKSGETLLTSYQSSSGKKRYFCSVCGTQIYSYNDGDPFYVVRVATFDDDPGIRPIRHIFVGDKAPWYTIDDKLPQYDQWPAEK
jgi:hypothetical protein